MPTTHIDDLGALYQNPGLVGTHVFEEDRAVIGAIRVDAVASCSGERGSASASAYADWTGLTFCQPIEALLLGPEGAIGYVLEGDGFQTCAVERVSSGGGEELREEEGATE